MPADSAPLGVFDLVTSIGGVQRVMGGLLPRLAEHRPVSVLDGYRHPDYADLFAGTAVEVAPLGPGPRTRYIGGASRAARLWNLALRSPWLLGTGLRLRGWAERNPGAILWFNQLPALTFFSRFLPRRTQLVYCAHGFAAPGDVREPGRLSRRCASVIAVSEAVSRILRAAGVAPSRIRVVHNGVDVEALRSRAGRGGADLPERRPGDFVVAQVAVLAPNKRQAAAIEALALLPKHVQLWCCGGIPAGANRAYLEELKGLAARLRVDDRVRFLGWRDDVPAVLARADAVLLASDQESFGMALAEAMALGRPCVGTAVGGIPEVIEDGVTGWVTGLSPQALAAALAQLAASPELCRRMGARGRDRAETALSLAVQARAVEEVLRAVEAGPESGEAAGRGREGSRRPARMASP